MLLPSLLALPSPQSGEEGTPRTRLVQKLSLVSPHHTFQVNPFGLGELDRRSEVSTEV